MATANKAIFVVVLAVVLQLAALAAAVNHPVGGDGAWDASGTDYNAWASTQKIVQGDSVSFTYSPSHDVVEVTKAGYDACSSAGTTDALVVKSYTGGSTAVRLATPGKHYFICSVPGHCAAGMKLEVTARPAGATAPAPTVSKTKNKPPRHHQRSLAPAAAAAAAEAPAPAPAASSTTEVSTPTAAPAPGSSSDAASVVGALGAMGLAAGMALVLLAM